MLKFIIILIKITLQTKIQLQKKWSLFKFKQDAAPIVKFEGFMRLASDEFGDIVKFPPIPSKSQDTQQLNAMTNDDLKPFPVQMNKKQNFRINSQYVEGGPIPTKDSFYFRLNGDHILYSETATDPIVLQAMDIKDLKGTLDLNPGCFKIQDSSAKNWILCSTDGECPQEIRCQIDTAIGKECQPCPDNQDQSPILEIAPQMIIPVAAPNCKFDWNYNYHGQNWVCNCNEGLEQSPIDLPDAKSLTYLEEASRFDYQNITKDDLEVYYDINLFKIKTLNQKTFGTITDTDGTIFEAYEIHFHTPGDHTFNGLQTDMEVQVIHRSTEGVIGRQAILSILWQRTPGASSTVFDLFDLINLPNPQTNLGVDIIKNDLNIMNFIYDSYEEVDSGKPFDYYKYMGSRTTPPCEENVVWFIFENIRPISSTVLAMIRDVLNIPLQPSSNTNINFDGSNRAVQPLRARKLYFYDKTKSCFPIGDLEEQKQEFAQGHYEKITKPVMKYQYYEGFQPSGIKGSVVVNRKEADNLDESLNRLSDRYTVNPI